MKVLAGIVTYNPEQERLAENIKAIAHQVELVVVWNNGGDLPTGLPENIQVLPNEGNRNLGIASALNKLCEFGYKNGYDWIVTLDQDSVSPTNLVASFLKYTNDDHIGMLCPCIVDRNYGTMAYDSGSEGRAEDIDACITSASMLRLSAWNAIGGFWDELFIDMVDFDICWTLQEKGFRILRVNNVSLLHEIGHSRKVSFLGKEEIAFNHQPIRCYYMIRNMLIVGKKHNRLKKCLRWAIKRFLLINVFETQRLSKDWMMIKGFRDGFRNNLHS